MVYELHLNLKQNKTKLVSFLIVSSHQICEEIGSTALQNRGQPLSTLRFPETSLFLYPYLFNPLNS